jgi:hypothetical protein
MASDDEWRNFVFRLLTLPACLVPTKTPFYVSGRLIITYDMTTNSKAFGFTGVRRLHQRIESWKPNRR